MSTTPEEFFVKDLMEQPPASPPIFPDLPQMPNGNSEGQHHDPNNMILSCISRMLMEDDDGDDKLTDHPELLQVQQPFVQILRSLPFDANTNNREAHKDFLHEGHGGQSEISLPLSSGTYVVEASSLECMEEASVFLPKDNNFRKDEQVNQTRESNVIGSTIKKRYSRDHLLEEEVRSTSKAMMTIKEPEEKHGNEMLEKMMSRAYEACIKGMERVSLEKSGSDRRNKKSGKIKSTRNNMVDIGSLLMSCAQALAVDDHKRACELLMQIKQHASATGDAAQRLAHCFTKGLEARIGGKGSQIWKFHIMLEQRESVVEFLEAYNLYTKTCCFLNVTFIFLTMTIIQAMVGKSRLHIVDYGTFYGFQWAGLLNLLASKEVGPPEVKFTAINRPKSSYYPSLQIEKIGCRLMKCARELGFPLFKFQTIMRNWQDVSIMDLHSDVDEVLVVSDIFSFSILMEESIFFDSPNPRDTVLKNIKKMRPDVFIQSVSNRLYSSSFLSRFRELLFHYMAFFDMLDTTIPRESESRSMLEQVLLGHYVFNDISCEGMDLVERPEKYKQWQTRNQRAGLRQLPLDSSIVKAVEDEVTKHYHKDFMICKDGQWLLQGWVGRVLFFHTTWVAEDASSC